MSNRGPEFSRRQHPTALAIDSGHVSWFSANPEALMCRILPDSEVMLLEATLPTPTGTKLEICAVRESEKGDAKDAPVHFFGQLSSLDGLPRAFSRLRDRILPEGVDENLYIQQGNVYGFTAHHNTELLEVLTPSGMGVLVGLRGKTFDQKITIATAGSFIIRATLLENLGPKFVEIEELRLKSLPQPNSVDVLPAEVDRRKLEDFLRITGIVLSYLFPEILASGPRHQLELGYGYTVAEPDAILSGSRLFSFMSTELSRLRQRVDARNKVDELVYLAGLGHLAPEDREQLKNTLLSLANIDSEKSGLYVSSKDVELGSGIGEMLGSLMDAEVQEIEILPVTDGESIELSPLENAYEVISQAFMDIESLGESRFVTVVHFDHDEIYLRFEPGVFNQALSTKIRELMEAHPAMRLVLTSNTPFIVTKKWDIFRPTPK